MKLGFAGTPEFAARALAALLGAGHELALVLTQPDRPGGRGLKLQPSPVKQLASQHGLPVLQPRSLRLNGKYPEDALAAQTQLQAAGLDALVVAAYGLILPQWVLSTPRLGCFNIHASLLPRWRGAAPIHRAIEAGDAQTGVTIMQMDAGLDTGDMLLAQALPILPTDTTASLHDKLAELGAALMLQVLQQAALGTLQPQPQPAQGVTYAAKIDKAEASADWTQSAALLARRVRALSPQPGVSTTLQGEVIKLWAAHVAPDAAPAVAHVSPGQVLAVDASGIRVATGAGVLVITELQRPGGKRLAVADFCRGFDLPPGSRLG